MPKDTRDSTMLIQAAMASTFPHVLCLRLDVANKRVPLSSTELSIHIMWWQTSQEMIADAN